MNPKHFKACAALTDKNIYINNRNMLILHENEKIHKILMQLETHISSSGCEISETVEETIELEDCARD